LKEDGIFGYKMAGHLYI